MSVVVWDGKTIAADRQGQCADMKFTELKMRVGEGPDGQTVCAWTGCSARGKALAEWFFKGAAAAEWPEFQKDKDDWCRLIVATPQGCIFYEHLPIPFQVHDATMAWGSGRDFAVGALAMGADARRAVEVACQHSTGCGFGVEAYDFV